MKKRKQSKRPLGLKVGGLIALATFIMTVVAFVVAGVQYFDGKFAAIDSRFGKVEARLDGIDHRLDRIENQLTQTSDLLDSYLMWRFTYTNDPIRKHLIPIYDPTSRKLEFVDPNAGK